MLAIANPRTTPVNTSQFTEFQRPLWVNSRQSTSKSLAGWFRPQAVNHAALVVIEVARWSRFQRNTPANPIKGDLISPGK